MLLPFARASSERCKLTVQDPYSEQGTSSPSDFNTPDSDEVIDLSYYWSLIRRHLWKVISLSAICTVIAALVVLVMTPVYTATSTLLIESKEA